MYFGMVQQLAVLLERLPTRPTVVRLVTCMKVHMFFPRVFGREGLVADPALKRGVGRVVFCDMQV